MPNKVYTIAQKMEQGREAWEYSARGFGVHRIAKEMGLAHNTITARLNDYAQAKRELWKEEDIRAVATYEEVIRRAWEKFEKVKDNAINSTGFLNTIIAARKAIDDIVGVKAPVKTETEVNVSYRDYTTGEELEELFGEIDAYLDAHDGEADSEEPLDTEQANP